MNEQRDQEGCQATEPLSARGQRRQGGAREEEGGERPGDCVQGVPDEVRETEP